MPFLLDSEVKFHVWHEWWDWGARIMEIGEMLRNDTIKMKSNNGSTFTHCSSWALHLDKEREHQIDAFRKRNSHTFPLYLLLYAFSIFFLFEDSTTAQPSERIFPEVRRDLCVGLGASFTNREWETQIISFWDFSILTAFLFESFFSERLHFFARFLYFPFRIQQILSSGQKGRVCAHWLSNEFDIYIIFSRNESF